MSIKARVTPTGPGPNQIQTCTSNSTLLHCSAPTFKLDFKSSSWTSFWWVLYFHFILSPPQVGGQLLPDLIQFYQWLHTHLAHQVTHRRAYSALSIGRVVALASRRMPRGMATQLQELYLRVKGECGGLFGSSTECDGDR